MTSYQEADGATDGGLKGFSRYTSCLIPIIAALVLLAIGVTGINYLVDGEQARDATATSAGEGEGTDDSASKVEPDPPPPASSPSDSEPTYSTEGILAVMTGHGWKQFGELAHYELGNRQRQTRKYRRGDAQLSVTVHSFKSDRVAQSQAETLGAASRRVRFGHKVTVLEPLNKVAEPAIPGLIERLETYRDMVRE
jgi:hypothetical protein